MRNYRIDFNLTDPFPDGRVIGRIGEKNAACLVITPPAEMAENENITNYVAVFATSRGTVETDPYIKAEQFTVAVTERLSVGYSMAVQLEGRDDANNLIVKTPLIHGLTFEASAVRCACNAAGGFGQNTALPSHYHRNLDVLNKLGEAEDSLTFNGKAIGAQNVKTLELRYDKGEMDAMTDCNDSNNFALFVYDGLVPENAPILSVEFKVLENRVESDWIDVRDMYLLDMTSPYIIHGYRARILDGYGGAACVAAVHFLDRTPNKFHDLVSAMCVTALRVSFIDESGAE